MKITIKIILLLSINFIYSQFPGEVDNTFNINNISNPSGGITNSLNDHYTPAYGKKIFTLSNGKVIIDANTNKFRYNELNDIRLLRLNSDGSIDYSFVNNFNIFQSIDIVDIVELPDSKFLVSGVFVFNDINIGTKNLLKFNNDGTIDSSFQIPSFLNGYPNEIALQNDGKIVLVGYFQQVNSQNFNRIVRLNSDGTIDSSFSIGIGFNQVANCVKINNTNKIYVGGNFTNFNGTNVNRIIKLNENGSVDNSFIVGQGFDNVVNDIDLQNEKLIVVGDFTTYNNIGLNNNKIVRLNDDGSKDNLFQIVTTNINGKKINKIKVETNGDFIVNFDYNYNFIKNIHYFSIDGADNLNRPILSNSYTNKINDFSIDSLNNIYLTGDFDNLIYNDVEILIKDIIKLNPNGIPDVTFNRKTVGLNASAIVNDMVQQPDGKILICGIDFSSYNDNNIKGLFRINLDGTLDNSFNFPLVNGNFYDILLYDNGKILIAGNFTYTYNSIVYKDLIRLNSDGSIDTSFNVTINVDDNQLIASIALQLDKILVGVSKPTTSSSSTSGYGYVYRLLENGQIDNTFNTIYLIENSVTKIKVLNDNKFFVSCGLIPSLYNLGKDGGAIKKFNANGTTDTSFFNNYFSHSTSTSFYNDSVYDFEVLNNNSLIVIGEFKRINSNNVNKIIKLSNNGIIDNTFNAGVGIDGAPYCVKLLSNNKLLVGGNFSKYNNFNFKSIVSLNLDGSVNNSFGIGTGFDYKGVNSILVQSDSKIIFGGYEFSYYNNYVVGGIVRILGGGEYNITGSSKLDINNNGCDNLDVVFPNMKFNINNGTNNFDFFADYSGNYNLNLNAGNYSITPIVDSNYSVNPSSISVQFPTQGTYFNQNYCLNSINGVINDLNVIIIPLNAARPGFISKYKIIYKNEGTITRNGDIILNFDDNLMDFSSSNFALTSNLLNELRWSFLNLRPQETRVIEVSFLLNTPTNTPPLNSGNILIYNINITNDANDITPENNSFVLNQNVVNSFDPNDKTCLEGSVVGIEKIGNYVNYMIRFENTGTYQAHTIKILDYIDTNKFDVSTLRPVHSSHPMVIKISENNKVEFIFEGINLPFQDEFNDGYLVYKIKLKNNLTIGDTFTNSANIYFDYNFPIVTNTSVTTISVLANNEFNNLDNIKIYPNPTNGILFLENVIGSKFQIFNTIGQLIIDNKIENRQIDISNLNNGVYLLKLLNNGRVTNFKIIKK